MFVTMCMMSVCYTEVYSSAVNCPLTAIRFTHHNILGDFTFWISLSLRPNFRLRPNLIQKVKWRFWFGLSESLSGNCRWAIHWVSEVWSQRKTNPTRHANFTVLKSEFWYCNPFWIAIFFTKLVAMAMSLEISKKEVQIDHLHPKCFHLVKILRKSVQRILR